MFARPLAWHRALARSLSWCGLLGLLGTAGAAAQAPIVVFPGTATVPPESVSGGPYQASFLVQHKGTAEAIAYTCSGTGGITCTTIEPATFRVQHTEDGKTVELTCISAGGITCTKAEPADAPGPQPEAVTSTEAVTTSEPACTSADETACPGTESTMGAKPAAAACTKAAVELSCTGIEPGNALLGDGRVTHVVVTYTVSALGTGTLLLRAQGETSKQMGLGQLTIPIVAVVESPGTASPDASSTDASSIGT